MTDTLRKHYIAPADLIALWIGGGLCAMFAITAMLAPFIAPHDPLEQDLINSLLPPLWMPDNDPAFILGTDSLGRDLLSRLVYGCLLYTSPSPRDKRQSRMPSSA